MILRQALIDYRKGTRKSLRKLANELGVHYTVLQRFESGKEINQENFAAILGSVLKNERRLLGD